MPFPEGLPENFVERAGRAGLKAEDVEEFFARGHGKGGQNRNKRSTSVQLRHVPTGIIVRCEHERMQHQNRMQAWEHLIMAIEEERERQEQMNAYQHFLERKEHARPSPFAKEHMLHEKRHQKKKKERRAVPEQPQE